MKTPYLSRASGWDTPPKIFWKIAEKHRTKARPLDTVYMKEPFGHSAAKASKKSKKTTKPSTRFNQKFLDKSGGLVYTVFVTGNPPF
jgi:hypothetical protein